MNIQKQDGLLSVVLPGDLAVSPSSQQLLVQDEETSDCPLLTPSPPPGEIFNRSENAPMFNPLDGTPLEMTPAQTLDNINSEDVLNGYMNMVMLNSSSKPLNDEPSSRDPMVESSSSSVSSSGDNEPVCTQLLTQLNTAYQHLAPDAQALFYNQENGGKPPLVGIQLAVHKSPTDYCFMAWNWPLIRKACFWSLMSFLAACVALAVGVIAMMPKRCDPPVEWWQGSVFYEIFPPSFQDALPITDGVGDLRGIAMRLDYIKDLGVQGIRLNSIFPAADYPKHYADIESLIGVHQSLGSLNDFNSLVLDVHRRNMSLILDLPLYPYVKTFEEGNSHLKPRKQDRTLRERRDTEASLLTTITPTPEPTSFESITNAFTSVPPPDKGNSEPNAFVGSAFVEPDEDHVVTKAIKFWLEQGVDGFYLKGLERYAKEKNFVALVRHWKSLVGPNRILLCNIDVLTNAPTEAVKNVILDRIDLLDVTLDFSNGTTGIKNQVDVILNGVLFQKPGNPWVHWSVGSVDTKRIGSSLNVNNASIAASLLGMMLPGTPNIFYGDEIGLLDCKCEDYEQSPHLHNLIPMKWEAVLGSGEKFTSNTHLPWLPEPAEVSKTSLVGSIKALARIRAETPTIYINAVYKDHEMNGNCEIRYTADELLVLERWYPRRNSYVLVANFGSKTQTRDLSSFYYGGHVVAGAAGKIQRNVFFKEFSILPGEALVIKLDK